MARYKIINLIVFLIALFGLNFGMTSSLSIPTGDRSLWFHSGLLLIVFGSYWAEYYFTKPSDVVINGLVAFISISTLENPPNADWWRILKFYSLFVSTLAFLVVWHGSPAIKGTSAGPFKHILYHTVVRLGNSRVIFSLVFLLAAISYFGLDAKETKYLLGFWTSLMIVKHLELDSFAKHIWEAIFGKTLSVVGSLTSFKRPGFAVFSLGNSQFCPRESMVAFTVGNSLDDLSPIGIVTTVKMSADQTECEAIIVDGDFDDSAVNSKSNAVKVAADNPLVKARIADNPILGRLVDMIGYATRETSIGTLRFDLIRRPKIEEGHLVGVSVEKNREVLFQTVSAKHVDDSMMDVSQRRFTLGTAEQVGTWNNDNQCFETYSWVVPENSPVFHITKSADVQKVIKEKVVDIGNIPNSNYPVNINLTDLTLYHSAILGVTGSGKSFLAYHLIESLAQIGVHVICLDVTGDHKRCLKGAVQLKTLNQIEPFLNSDQKIGIVEFHEEKIHPTEATKRIADKASDWCKNNRRDDEIKAPTPKVVIVLEEAHTLIPEWNFNPQKNLQDTVNQISQVVLQARKFGLGFMIITQRTANVTKSILNQCNTIFSFQAYDETGFDFLKNYMGQEYVRALPNLRHRHGVLVGKASLSDRPLIVRFHDQDRKLNDSIPEFAPPAADINQTKAIR